MVQIDLDCVFKSYIRSMSVILSLNYLPNILWMRYFLQGNCVIDVHEHFVKQTYRNRADILSCNGPLTLSIPIKKTATKMPVNTLISDSTVTWQRQHWESIKSAYGSTPYFLYYADVFEKCYSKPVSNIMDFELELLNICLTLLKVDVKINLSENYLQPKNEDLDLRNIINPKVKTTETFKPYIQIFVEKYPFTPNLSVIDVLLNYGPRSLDYILNAD